MLQRGIWDLLYIFKESLSRKMTQCLSLISDPFRINCKKLRTLNMDRAVYIGSMYRRQFRVLRHHLCDETFNFARIARLQFV